MNREAVALGVPVHDVCGSPRAVDESLVNAGRPASSPPRTTCNSRNGLNREHGRSATRRSSSI